MVRSPPNVIKEVLSCIPKDFLGYFVNCKALIPYILPYITEHVVMCEIHYPEFIPIESRRFVKPFIDAPVIPADQLMSIATEYNLKLKNVSVPLTIEMQTLISERKLNAYKKTNLAKTSGLPGIKKTEDGFGMEDIMAWGVRYLPLFCRIDLLHIVTEFDSTDTYFTLAMFKGLVKLGTVVLKFNDGDALEKTARISTLIPPTLTCFRFTDPRVIPGHFYTRFTNLKELQVENMLTSQIEYLPNSLEMLILDNLVDDEDLKKVVVPKNLKVFKSGVERAKKNYLKLIHAMKNLEVLKLVGGHFTKVDDLKLSESKITKLSFVKCGSVMDYSNILKFTKLRKLRITDGRFPEELLKDESSLPSLRIFRFTTSWHTFWRNNLNEFKFPKNLTRLDLQGEFVIDKWEAPQKLRKLQLFNCNFVDIKNCKLPPNLVYFQIGCTKLTNLDNVQFPTGLIVLILTLNDELESMANTNLPKLTQFKDVAVRYNGSSNAVEKKTKALLKTVGVPNVQVQPV